MIQVSTEACKNIDISRDMKYHPENKVLPFVPNSDHKAYRRQTSQTSISHNSGPENVCLLARACVFLLRPEHGNVIQADQRRPLKETYFRKPKMTIIYIKRVEQE